MKDNHCISDTPNCYHEKEELTEEEFTEYYLNKLDNYLKEER